MNIDFSDENEPLFNVVTVIVDTSFVCSVEDSVDSTNMDVTTVEVTVDNVSEDVSAAAGIKVTMVVSLVDMSDDDDRDEYSAEVDTSSFVVVTILVKVSVVSNLAVDTADV